MVRSNYLITLKVKTENVSTFIKEGRVGFILIEKPMLA